MITSCVSIALAVVLNFTPVCSDNTKSPIPLTDILPVNEWVGYDVEQTESLKTVALMHYGSEDHWTTVWNDNPSIGSPDTIEAGTVLKIRANKPEEAEELASELAERVESLDESIAQTRFAGRNTVQSVGQIQSNAFVQNTQPAAPQPDAPKVLSEEQINFLGACEAGNDPTKNTGNGYYGAFQFSYGTWKSMGTGYERADLAPLEVQKAAVQRLVQRSSIHSQFPGCANRMRNAGLI